MNKFRSHSPQSFSPLNFSPSHGLIPMPPEQSIPRGTYARTGGGYQRGRGRGSWRGGSQDHDNGGGGRNKYYPGRSQNPDAENQNGGERWGRPRTSTPRDQNQTAEADVNMPMVQADEIPSQAMQPPRTAPPRAKQAADCPWIDWDVYLPQEGTKESPRTV